MLKSANAVLIKLGENINNPFVVSDKEFDLMVAEIKKERGDKLTQVKRDIRVDFAEKHDLHFAMDGGFMDNHGDKQWPVGGGMFALLWQDYEEMILDKKREAGELA